MFYHSFSHSQRGFTLIELMIAMTIFAIMSVMIVSVYASVTNTSRKLSATRHLSETAREITERIGQDVREAGISPEGWTAGFAPTSTHIPWTEYNYEWSGTEFLAIQSRWTYVYGKRSSAWMDPCIDTPSENRKSNPKIHCGLYFVASSDNGANAYNLVDSFIPEEEKKRVKIQDFRFYVSWSGTTTPKVTLNFTLALMPRIWVPESMIQDTKLHIQTTISSRSWKK